MCRGLHKRLQHLICWSLSWCQRLRYVDQTLAKGERHFKRKTFFHLNTVNLKFSPTIEDIPLKIKPRPCYRIMEGFTFKVCFPQVDPDLGYWYIEKLTPEIGGGGNTFCTLCLWAWGFHANPVFFLNVFIVDCRPLWIFLVIGQWRRYNLEVVCCCLDGNVRS